MNLKIIKGTQADNHIVCVRVCISMQTRNSENIL